MKTPPAFVDEDLLKKLYQQYKYNIEHTGGKPATYDEWLAKRPVGRNNR